METGALMTGDVARGQGMQQGQPVTQHAVAVSLAAAVAVSIPIVLRQGPIAGIGRRAQTQAQG